MRQRTWIPTAVMVGIAAIVIVFAAVIMPVLERPPEDEDIPTPVSLWELTGATVTRITLKQGLRLTTVERVGMAWRVVDPLAGEADSLRLDSVVYQILSMVATRTLEGDPAIFGFTVENATQVTLNMSDGTTIEFAIGDENPGGTSRYVKKSGDPTIYLVPISYVADLVKMVDYPPYPATPVPPTAELSPLGTPTISATLGITTTEPTVVGTPPISPTLGTTTPEPTVVETLEAGATAMPTEEAAPSPTSKPEPTPTPTPTS